MTILIMVWEKLFCNRINGSINSHFRREYKYRVDVVCLVYTYCKILDL